ncbi:DUF2189 domain-containing protein [Salinarimonas sp. NSM]|uniref:DUF2189 domain-containing protein n=1 Tax=Salinarimonas sp. NSM TaxID=3458003 RepID=UPI0040366459
MADITNADHAGAPEGTPGADAEARPRAEPVVRAITQDDVRAALAEGLSDFRAAPQFGLFFGAVYALGGIALVLLTAYSGMGYLVYPLAAGFALIGPFVAVGLYEVSRRRETGERLAFGPVLGVVFGQSKRELGWMAFVTLFIMIIWMYQVRLLLAIFLGYQSFATLGQFLTVVFTTPEGLMFLVVGNIVGAVLAAALFSLTVVSFPLLLDRDVDFITAMITSVKAVVTSPKPMLGWAAFIVALLVLAIVPFFLGLLIVLPALGHATWRLYRRVVEPAPGEGAAAG